MKKKWIGHALWLFVLTAALFLQPSETPLLGAIGAEGEPLIIPQMFSVSNGDSLVVLQNLSGAQQDISVEFFAQDGSFFDLITATVAALGEAQVATPAGPAGQFQGWALIFGNSPFTARGQWNFNIAGNPVAVGVPSIPMSRTSSTFQMPIGSVAGSSLLGVAIANPGASQIDCTATYRNQSGQAVAEELISIPGFGQASQFAGGIEPGFEGSGSAVCTGMAAVIAVIQEQVNGFPTPVFAVPVP